MSATLPPGPPPLEVSEERAKVSIPRHPSFWRRLFAFAGPAYLVSVGYMDPGNWATDIAAGSQFGYGLLWVLVMSNIMAILLQSHSARLGIVARMDLAQACRAMFDKKVSFSLWVLAEIAIAATDLAEILGSAIGLQLLFGLPLIAGVILTAVDSLLILILHSRGVRLMEAFIVVLVTTIGVCLGIEIFLARPEWRDMAGGLVPSLPGEGALYLAIGILGATVMPHNLYLHSGLVQSRRIQRVPSGIRSGIRFNIIDSVVALNGALFVNAALLIMAAAAFHSSGLFDVTGIQDAHRLLEPLLGASLAPLVFAIALIASGQSSTITGTLAGQIVMEGFIRLRMRPIVRRLLTRAVAIVPAVIVIATFGEQSTGDLLVLSQVILSLQLSFAVLPLIHVVSDRRWMGQYAIGPVLRLLSWAIAAVIASLNLWLAWETIGNWLRSAGSWAWLLWATAVPLALGLVFLLGYVMIVPILERRRGAPTPAHDSVHGPMAVPAVEPPRAAQRIAAAVDFSDADGAVLSHAVTLARAGGRGGRIVLLHVVESGGARLMGAELEDQETRTDQERLELYAGELVEQGVETSYDLGFGEPVEELAELVRRQEADLLVVGSHGHRAVGDFVYGTSVDRLRHKVSVPVLVVPPLRAEPDA